MAKRRTKPSGLQEFEATLHDLQFAGELLHRLDGLPESNFSDDFRKFAKAMKRVEAAEQAAIDARNAARKIAMAAWNKAWRNWTVAELQKATGYDEDY